MPWFWQGIILLIFVVPVIVLFGYATWDTIRRPDTSVLVRAAWLVGFCILPIVGPLVYLVIREPGTTAAQKAGGGALFTSTEELTALADLHQRGELTDREYELAKAQTVGVDLSTSSSRSVREQRGGQLL
jgi:hypothetical protein